MNSNQRNGFSFNTFLAVMFIAVIILAIVMAALAVNMLWSLIGGVFVVGLIIIALAWIGVNLFSRWTAARISARSLDYAHDEQMAKIGFLPAGDRYRPIVAQIAAPAQPRQKVFDFNPNDIHTASVNYLLYSINLLGENGNRLASAPECAAATNLENYSSRSRDRIIKHLAAAYGVVTQPGPIENGGGTFVPEAFGTVGRLYHHVMLNSAVESLPENKR